MFSVMRFVGHDCKVCFCIVMVPVASLDKPMWLLSCSRVVGGGVGDHQVSLDFL